MLLPLLMLGMMEVSRRGIIVDAFRNVISPIERRGYNQMESQILTHILGILFRSMVLGMGLYLMAGNMEHCTPWGLCICIGLILLMHGVKLALAAWVNFVFNLTRQFRLIYTHYVFLWTAVAMLTYPCILAVVRFGVLPVMNGVIMVLVILYLIATMMKLLRSIPIRWITIPYTLLYLMTVEVMPILGVLYLLQLWKL